MVATIAEVAIFTRFANPFAICAANLLISFHNHTNGALLAITGITFDEKCGKRGSSSNSVGMACRIERLSGKRSVVLRVSGRIGAEHIEMLREMLAQEKGEVAVDLEEVLIVDRNALEPLARFEQGGVELRNCPAYVREWIINQRAGASKGRRDDVTD